MSVVFQYWMVTALFTDAFTVLWKSTWGGGINRVVRTGRMSDVLNRGDARHGDEVARHGHGGRLLSLLHSSIVGGLEN